MLNTSNNSRIYASEYGYDRNNNVNKIGVIAGNTGVSMTYTYGKDNLPSAYTAGTNSGAYTYDNLNRLKSNTSSITPTVSYNYTSGTAMVSQELCDGVTITYFYDKNGNISSKKEGSNRSFYTYDEFNRLTIEQNEALNQTITYKYDAWGNIAMKKVYSGTSTLTPSSSNLIKAYDYVYSSSTEGMDWKDLMTEYDGKTITYDSIGNPTSYMGSTMYWEGRTLVEQIKNGATITYSYDSSDMRTSKTVGGVKHNYYYVEGKLMYEDCPSYKLFYTYDANGFLSGIRRINSNGTTENFGVHCNIFGDVISIYYRDGSLAATYTYDSWGKLLSVTDMSGNDISDVNDIWTQNSIRYRGYVYDEETQLYYLQSRYYDPETCRFINADDYSVLTASPTALSDKNLFAYCDSNPIVRMDTQGALWDTVFDAVSLAFSIADVVKNPNDPLAWVGLAADAISLVVPFATGGGTAVKAFTKVDDVVDVAKTSKKVSNTVDTVKTGWKVGDDVTNLTKAGNTPSWTTVRQRYWKNEAYFNKTSYSSSDLNLMKKGRAPIGNDGFPIELHHTNGRKGDNFFIFTPLTRTDHMDIHYGVR